jgi:hypothetical protein
LLDRVLAAYGGRQRWAGAEAVEAKLSCGGILFRWKRRGAVDAWRGMDVRAQAHEPKIRIAGWDKDGNIGFLEGHDVRLESQSGKLVSERRNARDVFPYTGGRWTKWDSLDALYFVGQATWNYLTFPALLMRDDIEWRELSDTKLEAMFPGYLPTHTLKRPMQYHFDPETHLLKRYDYIAEIFGDWADGAHLVLEHGLGEGIPYPSKRLVQPRDPILRVVVPIPRFLWLEISGYRLVSAS